MIDLIARGVLKAIKLTTGITQVQVMLHRGGETEPDVESFEHAGFTSAPEDGAEAVVVHPFGLSDSPIVIMISDRRYRPKDLASGEAVVYAPMTGGKQIRLDATDVKLGDGATLGVARDTDPTTIDATTDAALYTWLAAVGTATGAGAPPVTITGKINGGSAVVKAVN